MDSCMFWEVSTTHHGYYQLNYSSLNKINGKRNQLYQLIALKLVRKRREIALKLVLQHFAKKSLTNLCHCEKYFNLLYSWHFSRYSAPIHWLVHGHMTSNNETVYRQMPWVGNDAKTNGKIAHCYPRNVDMQLLHVIRACSCGWPDVVAGNSAGFLKICLCVVLLY